MILGYSPRLICLALACFFAVFASASLLVAATQPWAIRFAATREPRQAANLLLGIRLLPITLAAFFSLALSVPSYMLFEPEITSEPVGPACLALAILGCAICGFALIRGIVALYHSLSFTRKCRHSTYETISMLDGQPAWVIETCVPCLALIGFLRPRVIISRSIVEALSPEELRAVFSHENAHRENFDNVKRLLLRLAPGPAALEQAWGAFAEYAADRRAVRNSHHDAIALASALVRVARFGSTATPPFAAASFVAPSAVGTAFLAEPSQLAARINRLLSATFPDMNAGNAEPARSRMWLTLSLTIALLAILFQPFTFRILHSFLEHLL